MPFNVKIDLGVNSTGMAVVRGEDSVKSSHILHLSELTHRRHAIRKKMGQRANYRSHKLLIKAIGRGSYQRTRVNAAGFPCGYLMRKKAVHGFATGDIVKAEVSKGKKKGTYIGRVAVRKTGNFNIQTKTGTDQGISWRYCQIISRQNGYNWAIPNSSPT